MKRVKFDEMDSTSIAALKYHKKSESLDVTFRGSGNTYCYFDVCKEDYEKLLLDKSLGEGFNAYIKPNHGFIQLDGK